MAKRQAQPVAGNEHFVRNRRNIAGNAARRQCRRAGGERKEDQNDSVWAMRARKEGSNSRSNHGCFFSQPVLRQDGCGKGTYWGANSRHARTVSVRLALT